MTRTQQTLPDLARTARDAGIGTVSNWTRSAASTARRHRQEILILAATAVFVLVVLLLGVAALF